MLIHLHSLCEKFIRFRRKKKERKENIKKKTFNVKTVRVYKRKQIHLKVIRKYFLFNLQGAAST